MDTRRSSCTPAENGDAGVGRLYSEEHNLESYEGRIGPNCRSLPSDNRGLPARQDDPQTTRATGDWMKPLLGGSEAGTRSTVPVQWRGSLFAGRSIQPGAGPAPPVELAPARPCGTTIVGSSNKPVFGGPLADGFRLNPSGIMKQAQNRVGRGFRPDWLCRSPLENRTAKRS
jgi:hypothetical protein